MEINVVTEEEFLKNKQEFEERLDSDIEYKYVSTKINWNPKLKNYKEAKEKIEELVFKLPKMVFVASCKDVIKGKPQLIYQTKQRISLIKKLSIYKNGDKFSNYERREIISYKLLGEKVDRNEKEIEDLCMDFWVYKLTNNEYEFYLFSENKIDEVSMILKGMEMSLSDLSELNQNLKIKRISRAFFVKEIEKDIKLIENKETLIEFSKGLKYSFNWDKQGFMDFIFTNEDEKQYNYTEEFKNLRIAQLLSGKYEGYPLHLMKIGPVGTGKTTEAETLAWKFQEDEGILEAGNSTFKALVPSFKEKPANLGFIARCNRVAIIDELMKMVQKSLRDGNGDHNIYFGELNMLLEHKERKIGSGNDNSIKLKNNSKIFITSNPLEKRYTLSQHLNYVDNTTLSRMVVWIQDWKEVNQIYLKNDIKTNKIFQINENNINSSHKLIEKSTNTVTREQLVFLQSNGYMSVDFFKQELINHFLTIYDSCNCFLVDFDLKKIKEIFHRICNKVKQELKPVWSSRGLHHSVLILDGLTKYRCLFQDYDKTFTPKDEDYEMLDKILNRMVENWDTQFQNNNILN